MASRELNAQFAAMLDAKGLNTMRVLNGPSKFDLMLSLFDGNQHPRRTVSFQIEGFKKEVTVAITSVQQEDGSGESWNWEGFLRFAPETKAIRTKGYFSTKHRTGYFKFEPRPDSLDRLISALQR